MARQARCESIDPQEVQVVHAVQRCVRQAFLCGIDKNTGNNYEHRRQWIRHRLEFLASVFGIDCLTYTVMSNHKQNKGVRNLFWQNKGVRNLF